MHVRASGAAALFGAHAWPAAHVVLGAAAKAHALAVRPQAAGAGRPPSGAHAPLSTSAVAVAELPGAQYVTGPQEASISRVPQAPPQTEPP
jgi:hypothetical protein